MRTGKVLLVCIITSLITSTGIFFLLRSLSSGGSFSQSGVSVPSVVGMRIDQARQILEPMKLSLIVSEQHPDPSMTAGQIISQNPSATSQVKSGTAVQVVISTGKRKVKMPNLTGLTLSAALRALSVSGLKPGKVRRQPNATVSKDRVISGSVPPGSNVTPGTSVVLIISSGIQHLTVPSVMNLKLNRARIQITRVGLKVGKISYTYNENFGGNVVLRQNPARDTKAVKGSVVDLVVNEAD